MFNNNNNNNTTATTEDRLSEPKYFVNLFATIEDIE